MNHHERIKAALYGEPCDRIPFSFWTHLPGIDLDPVRLAEATHDFYQKYKPDFIKTMNNGMYAVEDFGCVCDFSEVESGGVARIVQTPVNKQSDWSNVGKVSLDTGALKRELRSLEILLDLTQGRVPVVFTVFSPITIANKLCNGQLKNFLESGDHEELIAALNDITETTAAVAGRAIELGASGIFFATQLSSYDAFTLPLYTRFGIPFDLKVLEAARDGWLNILHIHGQNIMFDALKDYPVNCINWHIWETEPDLISANKITDKCLMGGLVRTDITRADTAAIQTQVAKALEQTNGRKLVLTPGCVIRYPVNHEVLKFIGELSIKPNPEK